MSLLLLKSLAILAIMAISLIAGLAPIRQKAKKPEKTRYPLSEAFAAGIFLGAALFHMLPDADNGFKTLYGVDAYPYTSLYCALGFILLLFLERLSLHLAKLRDLNINVIPYVLTLVLSVHALTEGAALGVNNEIATTLIIFLAIMVHKGSESFALAAGLARSQLSIKQMYTIFFVFVLITPIGIAAGVSLLDVLESNIGSLLESIFNALAAGSFLYIATLHQLDNACDHGPVDHLREFTATLIGLSVMALAAIWV